MSPSVKGRFNLCQIGKQYHRVVVRVWSVDRYRNQDRLTLLHAENIMIPCIVCLDRFNSTVWCCLKQTSIRNFVRRLDRVIEGVAHCMDSYEIVTNLFSYEFMGVCSRRV